MKIAMFYESRLGRNDGPPLYWNNALKTMGHEITHLSSQHPPDGFGPFDLHLWVDWGEDALVGVLPYHPISLKDHHPSVYITSDTHLGYDYRLNKAKEFDYVFCNQKRAVEEFERDGVKARWLPHAVEPKAFPCEPVCIKKYDIGFVGYVTFEKRAMLLDRMFGEFPNFFYGQRLFEECALEYRKSRIVFNSAAEDDLNMRVFEVLATKSFLLTEWVPTMEELFKDGKHLVTYYDVDEAVEKAKYYLRASDVREWITEGGWHECLSKHTYQHRAETMLSVVFENKGGE